VLAALVLSGVKDIMARLTQKERRAQLAELTLAIIAEKGLRRFTIAELAAAAGIAEGTIFRHFRSKKEIVESAISRMEQVLFQNFPPRAQDPIERLGVFFKQRLELVSSNPNIAALVFSNQLLHASGEAGGARVLQMRSRSREFVMSCLREAEKKGVLKKGFSPQHLFFVVHGSLASMVSALLNRQEMVTEVPKPKQLWDTLEKLIRR
jgi:AcrR family transcriptional regulator